MSRFRCILADPPWEFSDKLTMSSVPRGAETNYPILNLQEIAGLRVGRRVALDDSVLVLWVPSSLMDDGLEVMNQWGFVQKQVWTWVKVKRGMQALSDMEEAMMEGGTEDDCAFGMGRLARGCTEIALVGVRGSPYRWLMSKSERNVMFAPNAGHSVKPEGFHRKLERMFPEGPYLELFARRAVQGWATMGNEMDGTDIRDALCRLEVE